MNKSLVEVAVFLTAYNGKQWIAEQLESILQQHAVDLHLFISVDLSSDDTYEWCKCIEKNHSNVTVLKYGERFGGAAKNFYRLICDVDFSTFDYVAFADQDDVWELDKLSFGIKRMKRANAEAYSANVIAFWENGTEKLIDKSQPQRQWDYLFEAAGPGCTHIFSNKAATLIKKYLINFPELSGFLHHDWLTYAILRHNCFVWLIDSVPKMRYRQHDANQIGANASFKGIVFRVNYILSGQIFKEIELLVNTLGIRSIHFSSRLCLLRLALKARQLRRREIDQVFVFIALLLYAAKGHKN